MVDRRHAASGSPYEAPIGFARAIRVGAAVHVSGTGPVWPDGSCDPDPQRQAERCFAIALEALADLGGAPGDVVRTRMYLTDAADWAAVGRAHGARFAGVRPAATMVVVSGLLEPRWRVEVELDAVVEPGPGLPAT
jgi:enamine deaminase RidA (YjgF/YER057c/UK114 family)